MSDYLEDQASESDDGEDIKSRDSSDSEDEDDEDEKEAAEEMKDLIDDTPIQDEDDDSSEGGLKRKKKESDDDDDQLEDEDYELIEENLGIKVKKKHKRIRVISDDEDSGGEASQEAREAIANQLFVDDEDEASTAAPVSREAGEETYGDMGSDEESDVDDFIVDEEGQPISKAKRKHKTVHGDRALQEAQDIFGVDFDYNEFDQYDNEYSEEEEDDYEDEEEEGGERFRKKDRRKKMKKSIFDVFEPSELERGLLTDVDQEIKVADIPERYQLRSVPVQPAEKAELEEEAEWIYKNAFVRPTISMQDTLDGAHGPKGPGTMKKIKEALTFMRNQLLEVPFVAFYRKEYVEPELNINDLWRIWKWDEKWSQLKSRKENLLNLMKRMQAHQFEENAKVGSVLPAHVRPLTNEDLDRVRAVQSVEEYLDTYSHFMLYYGRDIPPMKESERKLKKAVNPKKEKEEGEEDEDEEIEPDKVEEPVEKLKFANRNAGYHICQQAGLADFVKKFGLTPEQFGENLRDNYQKHEVDQYEMELMTLANEFVCPQFPNPTDVLAAVQHMVAMQLAADPTVRRCIRQVYYDRSRISVRPTKQGLKEIDENHNCYSFKYLKGKPVKELHGDQFLRIHQAVKDGQLKMEITTDPDPVDMHTKKLPSYLEEIRPLYFKDGFSSLVQTWNVQRGLSLKTMLDRILWPQLERELRAKLLEEAQESVVKLCKRKLYNWLKVAPYVPELDVEEDDDFSTRKGVRVMAVTYVPARDQAAFAVIVDENGDVIDFLRLPHILKRLKSPYVKESEEKQEEIKKIKSFIQAKKPHVIVVAAVSREAMTIVEDFKTALKELEDEVQYPSIAVELVNNETAMVYAASNKAQADFVDYPELLRQAVSCARRLQDPLTEIAQLCNSDEDIICIKYHPLQDLVNRDQLLSALCQEFVNRVNEVGVDVNKALAHAHANSLVQFICGLGPRKAVHLLKMIKQHGFLVNRTQLVTLCHMGPKVFVNCAGFIKIDTNGHAERSDDFNDVLDGSRVHPETYEWARKMAIDALEYDDSAADVNPAAALEEILESPERLRDLDLDAFAEELERQGYGNKHITLYDIRAELNHRYKDLRVAYRGATAEERFNWLTKETPETLYVGKMVMASVFGFAHRKAQSSELDQARPTRNEETGTWMCPFCFKDIGDLSEVWSHFDAGECPGTTVGVRVRLDNGLTGFIHKKNLSDKEVSKPEDRVKVNMSLHARITKIDIEKFQVDLTSKSSDLQDENDQWKPQKDTYYDYDTEVSDKQKETEVRKAKARQSFVRRVIAHPSFKNVTYQEAETLLNSMDQGDVIIRPSSKGADHLTLTWKVASGIYPQVDIKEEGKENAFSLGKILRIDGEPFEDLDEIIARYVQPMAAFARDLINYKYYKDSEGGNRDIMDKILMEEKKKAPTRIPYYFSVTKELPGKFMLSYMPRNKTIHEFVTVTPEGIRYRGQLFSTLNSLIKWFKENFRLPIPQLVSGSAGTPGSSSVSRTPGSQSTGGTPRTAGLSAAVIQRAAASLPSNIYSKLAQVAAGSRGTPNSTTSGSSSATGRPATATPPYQSSVRGSAGTAAAAGAHSTAAYGYQTQPAGSSMALHGSTPTYVATPIHSLATPQQQYVATPRQDQWPGTTPRSAAALVAGSQRQQSAGVPRQGASTSYKKEETDWAKMAEMWAKTQEKKLAPAARRPEGDGTPLHDEH